MRRAVGWYVTAIVDILELAPQTDETSFLRTTIQSQLQLLARHLVKAADSESGVVARDDPARPRRKLLRELRCEYVHALLKGARLGYLEMRMARLLLLRRRRTSMRWPTR